MVLNNAKLYETTLREIEERRQAEAKLELSIKQLEQAMAKVKQLSSILPICMHCTKIRNDGGNWQQIEIYIRDHSEAEFSRGVCPDCKTEFYSEY